MEKVWHSFLRFLSLVTIAVWFLTTAHTVVCHSDNALCGHDGCSESTACTCACHIVFEPADEAPVPIDQPSDTVLIPSLDETIRSLLLPNDIFRPPLTVS